jgi:hypothetical protein
MKQDLFRKQDYRSAIREHACIVDGMNDLQDCLREGELEEATLCLKDINKSLEELKRLVEKEQQEKNLRAIVQKLVDANINITVVQRYVQ